MEVSVMEVDALSCVVESPQPTPESLNKRCRQKFSADDKELFVRILKEHMHVIERKAGDVLTLKRKHAAWRTVLNAYNEEASSERDLHQLRLLWKRMKKRSTGQLPKEDQVAPEEFTVMVDPFEIKCEPNINQSDNFKSSIPTPSPDSSDCLDLRKNEDDVDRPLQIVLDVENTEESRPRANRSFSVKALRCQEPPPSCAPRGVKCQTTAYEQRLLDMAEREHAKKMVLLEKRHRNEALREELLRLKIRTQLLKQDKCRATPAGLP